MIDSKKLNNLQTTSKVTCLVTALCLCTSTTNAFTMPSHPSSKRFTSPVSKTMHLRSIQSPYISRLYQATTPTTESSSSSSSSSAAAEKTFDGLLEASKLKEAATFLKEHPDEVDMNRERWTRIFDTVESVTSQAEANSINTRQAEDMENFIALSKSRMEMSDMYQTLQSQGHLRLFGSIGRENWPAAGSHTVRPEMLEQISALSMKALTPRPNNVLLYAGVAVAILEGMASIALGINLNALTFLTVVAVLGDRAFLNGAIAETFLKFIKPETQPKITRHEAGHFLVAYLLGCPVEGYVLSAWASLQDARFGARGVAAGTSFFDPALSSEMASSKVKRSSIDRYSIIVMAGIAAEAINYGQADGGAGDEMALIAFLSNLNGAPASNPAWNDVTIRNQARWGALQAVLMLREYKECYDALVDALERGGTLGDCIYAIENAGRECGKDMSPKSIGYILEKPGGLEEEWTTEMPENLLDSGVVTASMTSSSSASSSSPAAAAAKTPERSLEEIREYKAMMQEKLKGIEEKLKNM